MNFDDYENKLEYPDKPKKPEILRKSVDELTDEQLANVRAIKKSYEEAYSKYQEAVGKYSLEEARLKNKFRDDLRKEFRILDDALHARIYNYAWEHGHSSGFSEIYNVYGDIVNIIRG